MTPQNPSPQPLLKTKLSAPQPRDRLVSRPRLLNLMDEGASRAITLICAPAGYGKTTLLVDWISHLPARKELHHQTVGWLSLDEGDNDPFRFLSYLTAALDNVNVQISSQAAALQGAFPPPSWQAILTLLINDLKDQGYPVHLVLDDYQFISNPEIHECLIFLLDHLPDNLHLVLATRSDPPLPLHLLRARNQLVEVRAGALKFTRDEADLFLNQVMQLSLSPQDISTLETRTEGWVTGLQMASLSMQGRKDIPEFIQAFSGSNRYILDYLAEEVFNRQPENIQHFLLATSILDRLCSDSCSFLLDLESSTCQDYLEYLDNANLFLVRLDDERRWYRYHHLFTGLLRARLNKTQPHRRFDLHRRASTWYDQNGFPTEAIQHAIFARDFVRAADLIERHGTPRWSQGDPALIALASHLPPEILKDRHKLVICQAWMMMAQGQSAAAFSILDSLKGRLPEDGSPESIWMPAFIDLLSAYGAMQSRTGAAGSIPDHRALELIPEQDIGLRETADYLYAIILNRQGDFERSAEILDRFVRRETTANGPQGIFLVISMLARTRIMQGKLLEAAALCREYLMPVHDKGKRSFYAAGSLNIILGEVLYEWNQLEEAELQILEGIRDNESWKNITFDAIGYSDLVYVQMARGDTDQASETLRKLGQMLQGRALIPDLEEELLTYKVRLWLAKGDLASAGEWADRISEKNPQNFLQEWGWISFARVRLAQGRYGEAQEILETLIRLPGSGTRVHRQIRVYLLLAVTLFFQNQLPQALEALKTCLDLTETGGYLRVFLDSGQPVRDLLLAYLRTHAPTHRGYVQKLLDAFEVTSRGRPPRNSELSLFEPLTPRELEVLGLLAAGLSNRQVADRLILAEGTVKYYVHAVLEKLAVHSRTQAIARARELHLL